MHERASVGSTVVIKSELTAHEDVVIAGRVDRLIESITDPLGRVTGFTSDTNGHPTSVIPDELGYHHRLRTSPLGQMPPVC